MNKEFFENMQEQIEPSELTVSSLRAKIARESAPKAAPSFLKYLPMTAAACLILAATVLIMPLVRSEPAEQPEVTAEQPEVTTAPPEVTTAPHVSVTLVDSAVPPDYPTHDFYTREQLQQFDDLPGYYTYIRQWHIQREGFGCDNTFFVFVDGRRVCTSCGYIFTQKQDEAITGTIFMFPISVLAEDDPYINFGRWDGRDADRNEKNGYTIYAPYGTAIFAAADGEVIYAGWLSDYGNTVIIEHDNGLQTYYAHCSVIVTAVSEGQLVVQGETIALVGMSGTAEEYSLYYEKRLNGVAVNPANPFEDAPNPPASTLDFIYPLSAEYSITEFGHWDGGYVGHTGIDIAAPYRTEIYASASGKVVSADWLSGYGLTVIIEHDNGLQTLYAHCSVYYVSEGDYVTQGEVIALVGATGVADYNHLHFEVRRGDEILNPREVLTESVLDNRSQIKNEHIFGTDKEEEPTPEEIPFYPVVNPNIYGNTTGNLNNKGLAAIQGEWIYYTNSSDGNSLYKIRTDGTGRTKLNDESSLRINVVGEWVYYYSDILGDGGPVNSPVYKIRIDGTERTWLFDEAIWCMTVVGDWIYFSNEDGLYKIRTDATGRMKLHNDYVHGINVVGDWIYGTGDRSARLYKIRTDGREAIIFNDEISHMVIVVGDWIYYAEGRDGHVYRVRTDGTGKEKIIDDNNVSALNISGDWIYYMYWNIQNDTIDGTDSGLYRSRLDGTGKTLIAEGLFHLVNVADDWIFYRNGAHEIYKIRTNGTEHQRVN